MRARARFFSGACIASPAPSVHGDLDPQSFTVPLDFYAAYHVPFVATWEVCEHAGWLAAHGDQPGATALLEPVSRRAKRAWIDKALAQLHLIA